MDSHVGLGILAHLLRMGAWNLNTLRFGGDCTPQSSSDKVIGSLGLEVLFVFSTFCPETLPNPPWAASCPRQIHGTPNVLLKLQYKGLTCLLVGGFNPFAKIWVKMGSSSPIFGVKIKNVWNHQLGLTCLDMNQSFTMGICHGNFYLEHVAICGESIPTST